MKTNAVAIINNNFKTFTNQKKKNIMEDNFKEKQTRKIWCDGCYDLLHFGHANSLRQAKDLGDFLIVGLHSDEEIEKHKRRPIFTQDERYKMVESIKWVDKVIKNQPYITTLETLDKFQCDYCCHGDDITQTADGTDTYAFIKNANRYKEVKRTAGISTTNLMKRILSLNNDSEKNVEILSPWTGSEFYLTTEFFLQFSNNKPPKPGDKIIYTCGVFDLYHVGHVDFLKKAWKYGDYLIVGLYSDSVITKYSNPPIMTLQERILNLLACKYVSDVIFGAPYIVTKDLMDHFKIDLVVHGKTKILNSENGLDPFEYPKKLNKFQIINSENDLTTDKVIERIINNRLEIEEKNRIKEENELKLLNEMKKLDIGSKK